MEARRTTKPTVLLNGGHRRAQTSQEAFSVVLQPLPQHRKNISCIFYSLADCNLKNPGGGLIPILRIKTLGQTLCFSLVNWNPTQPRRNYLWWSVAVWGHFPTFLRIKSTNIYFGQFIYSRQCSTNFILTLQQLTEGNVFFLLCVICEDLRPGEGGLFKIASSVWGKYEFRGCAIRACLAHRLWSGEVRKAKFSHCPSSWAWDSAQVRALLGQSWMASHRPALLMGFLLLSEWGRPWDVLKVEAFKERLFEAWFVWHGATI